MLVTAAPTVMIAAAGGVVRGRHVWRLCLAFGLVLTLLPLHVDVAGAASTCRLPAVLANLGAGPSWSEISRPYGEISGPVCELPAALTGFIPSSVTSDAVSVFMLEASTGRVAQIKRAPDPSALGGRPNSSGPLEIVEMPTLPVVSTSGRGHILLGPRSFFAIIDTPWTDIPETARADLRNPGACLDEACPTLFRADHAPSLVRGDWRAIRPIGAPSDVILGAVLQSDTIWTLRADLEPVGDSLPTGATMSIGWQPLGAASEVRLPPAGPPLALDVGGSGGGWALTATRDNLFAFGSKGAELHAAPVTLQKRSPREQRPSTKARNPRNRTHALIHGNYIYLIGGNTTGPVIERARFTGDTIQSWEQFLDPSGQVVNQPMSDATIVAVTFARSFLWLFRDDGSIQVIRVADTAAGQARIAWQVDPRPRVVKLGQAYQIDVDWDYIGPMELSGLSANVAATPAQSAAVLKAGATRPAPFAWLLGGPGGLTETIEISGLLPSPTAPGPTLSLCVKIPSNTRRTEFLATILVRSNRQAIGPALRLPFSIETKKRPATETPIDPSVGGPCRST